MDRNFYPEPADFGGPEFIPAETNDLRLVPDVNDDLLDSENMGQESAMPDDELRQRITRVEQKQTETYRFVEEMGSVGVAI